MAYAANDLSVVVRGTLAGSEIWSNSWAFKSEAATPDPQDAVDILHSFYIDTGFTEGVFSSQWTAVDATASLLGGVGEVPVTWEEIAGLDANPMLPTECAIRLSFTGVDGARGGPFLAGFPRGSLEENGTLLSSFRDKIVGELQDMADALTASDWTLALRRPGPELLEEVFRVRVGSVFDVIRRRRNDLPENYVSVTFA